jgi:guanylate kinase
MYNIEYIVKKHPKFKHILSMVGKLFIIFAPSGAGKSTLVDALVRSDQSLLRVITYTSRACRPKESDTKDYHFISEEEFEHKIKQGFFLEWSRAYGAYYGTPRSVLAKLAQGQSFVIILDRDGAKAVKRMLSDAVLIWIYPPNIDTLAKRLQARASDSQDTIAYRLSLAKKEIEQEQVEPCCSYAIVNNTIDQALLALMLIVKKELKRV